MRATAAAVGDDLLIRLSATETLTLEGATLDDLSTDTVTTLDILGEDTTTNPAPFYFFFEYDEDTGAFVPTGTQNAGSDEAEDLVETLDGNDLLRGFGGNDTLDGGAGNDTLDGGAGDDVFRIAPGDGSDTITDFNADTDRLEFTDGLFANLEAVQASAAAVGDDLLIRLSATETLTLAGASEDALSTDTVTTLNAEGADTTTNPAPFYFFFEYDEDTGAFVPTGTQNAGSDEAEDLVETLDGNDLLRGFGGNDTLDGGAGNDTLDGGAGDDVFRIAPGDGSDTITDFNADTDRLEFTDGLFANLEAVQASAAAVGDDLLIRLSATETLTLAGASEDALSTDTVTTLNAEGADTTTNPAPFYFFFEYDEDTGACRGRGHHHQPGAAFPQGPRMLAATRRKTWWKPSTAMICCAALAAMTRWTAVRVMTRWTAVRGMMCSASRPGTVRTRSPTLMLTRTGLNLPTACLPIWRPCRHRPPRWAMIF